jgi:N-formylglutamate amidohydrolase
LSKWDEYVLSSENRLPILFACPHHGIMRLDRASLRVKENLPDSCKNDPGQKFSDDNDVFTRQLTVSIVNKITSLSRKKPYYEIAEFHRKYVDYNRCEECAFEPSSFLAKQAYLEYHNGILQKIEEMYPENENGLAFLFDIHGTGRESVQVGGQTFSFDVLIGTDEQRSIKALTDIAPDAWWDDAKGLIPLLRAKNISVFPPNRDLELQNHLLDGGYTIQVYGSSQYKKRLLLHLSLSFDWFTLRRVRYSCQWKEWKFLPEGFILCEGINR